MSDQLPVHKNPDGHDIPLTILQEFENGLDPLHPERSKIRCRVLGYGEISTVFEILSDGMQNLAFKRMSIFKTPDELMSYLATYAEYNHRLENIIGLRLPAHGYAAFVSRSGNPVLYIIQVKQAPGSIGNQALQYLSHQDTLTLFKAILGELQKVWKYNRDHPENQVGIDGQISNWAVAGLDRDHPRLSEEITLFYIDTSTPLLLQNGVEQLDPELFLRSAPPYLVWILRLLFVKDVMTRYYDARKVIIDLIANFFKEQKAELIPDVINYANEFISHLEESPGLQPITPKEVEGYYREDRLIWSLYLSMRRFDRFLRKRVLHREYPYILPGKIKR